MSAQPLTREAFGELYRAGLAETSLDPVRFGSTAVTDRLYVVAAKLIENARRFNLTAILDPAEIVRKHLLDSLLPLPLWEAAGLRFSSVLDVGTGAGFPLLPLACVLEGEGVRLCGLDATAKKISHILETASAAKLTSVEAVSGRAEDLAHGKMRESYDLVTARAVANLPVLMELSAGFVKAGGVFCAMKAHADEDESLAEAIAGEYGLTKCEPIDYELPGGDARRLVLFRKERPTPQKFPRRYAEILKQFPKK